ncbi:MAG TPA: hypothetical protein VFT74_07990, partial [Isosphaeraceae bacterium]|nr:hypothetical protein [Isosphaeraceae bacterium]
MSSVSESLPSVPTKTPADGLPISGPAVLDGPARSMMALLLVRLSLLSGVLVVALGGLTLLGWSLRVERLKRFGDGTISMNPMTAILLVLAGFSLLLALSKSLRRQKRVALSVALATIVMVMGLLKLLSLVAGFDFGLDHVLFSADLSHDYKIFDNRMAPNTALGFLLSGTSLMLLNMEARRRQSLAQSIALGAMMVSLLGLVGYLYHSVEMFSFGRGVPMA